MRLPNKKDQVPKFHYLTDHYITEFGLTPKLKLFKNTDDNHNVFYKFYNNDPIRKKGKYMKLQYMQEIHDIIITNLQSLVFGDCMQSKTAFKTTV